MMEYKELIRVIILLLTAVILCHIFWSVTEWYILNFTGVGKHLLAEYKELIEYAVQHWQDIIVTTLIAAVIVWCFVDPDC